MEDKRQLGSVEVSIENKIATIEFFHPSHNSLPGNLLAKLANTITEVGANEAVVVIILKSTGERTFCAGASFDELISIQDFDTGHAFFMGFANFLEVFLKIDNCCEATTIGTVRVIL